MNYSIINRLLYLEEIDHVVDRDEWVVDSHDRDGALLDGCTQHETTDAAETVDSHFGRHDSELNGGSGEERK